MFSKQREGGDKEGGMGGGFMRGTGNRKDLKDAPAESDRPERPEGTGFGGFRNNASAGKSEGGPPKFTRGGTDRKAPEEGGGFAGAGGFRSNTGAKPTFTNSGTRGGSAAR